MYEFVKQILILRKYIEAVLQVNIFSLPYPIQPTLQKTSEKKVVFVDFFFFSITLHRQHRIMTIDLALTFSGVKRNLVTI